MLTVRELIELLEETIENEESVTDETMVYIAHQPTYPLAEKLQGISTDDSRLNLEDRSSIISQDGGKSWGYVLYDQDGDDDGGDDGFATYEEAAEAAKEALSEESSHHDDRLFLVASPLSSYEGERQQGRSNHPYAPKKCWEELGW